MEAAGVSWISVHGRTKDQRKEPVNLEAVKLIRENVGIPVIANGDIKSLTDTKMVQDSTGVKGQPFMLYLLFFYQFCSLSMAKALGAIIFWQYNMATQIYIITVTTV